MALTRKDFIRNAIRCGIGVSLLPMGFKSGDLYGRLRLPGLSYSGKIVIIGAGTAGLFAGYLLKMLGIEFEILEASSKIGGRVQKLEGFADFPIDIGAEWIHTNPSILSTLLGNAHSGVDIDFIDYNPRDIKILRDDTLKNASFLKHFYREHKFKKTTWFDYLEEYIYPHVKDDIVFNAPVKIIEYKANQVLCHLESGQVYQSSKAIVTAPLSMIKSRKIQFAPEMPAAKLQALENVEMPVGLKVFVEFEHDFYPDVIVGNYEAMQEYDYYTTYYDAAFRKDTQQNIFGFFATGVGATPYAKLKSDELIAERLIDQLDALFDGQASQYYRKHFVQNWSKTPYIEGSYSHPMKRVSRTLKTLARPLGNEVFFAGEAYNLRGNYATVHGAAETAYDVIEQISKTL